MTADVRDAAVQLVDSRHGYTYEFSANPEAHLAEYDEEEARLAAALNKERSRS